MAPIRLLLAAAVLLASCATAPHQSFQREDRLVISGASGLLGDAVIQRLIVRGVPVHDLILVTRRPEDLAVYARLGASVRFGDLNAPESLPAAYRGGTRLLLISPPPAPKGWPERNRTAFEAAVRAGIRRIVYTSILGADRDLGDSPQARHITADHLQTERYLEACGARWIILRNGFYLDGPRSGFVVDRAVEMARTSRAVVPYGERRLAPLTHLDLADAAAAALMGNFADSRIYELTGAQLVGMRDIAIATTAATGRAITVVDQGPDQQYSPTIPIGPIDMFPSMVTGDLQRLTGHGPTSLQEYIDAHRDEILARSGLAYSPR